MSATTEALSSHPLRGRLTAFVAEHQLAWELAMAALTVIYVALALLVDEGVSALAGAAVAVLAIVFAAEFLVRFWDSASRLDYLKGHWIDLVTCLPAIGPLRVLRLLRLLGLLRLAHQIRALAYVSSRSQGGHQGLTWIVWPTALLLWLGAAEGIWMVERGHNPSIGNFGDALYMAFITVTTVGYGDVKPDTAEGKVIAGALVFLGLGLLGFISAQLTSRWLRVESRESAIESQLGAIRSELAELKMLLADSADPPAQ